MSKKKSLTILLLAVVLLLSGCSAPKQENSFKIQLQKNLTIEDTDENPHQNFFFIRTLDVDRAGNIYVLDQKKVLKFDKSGKFLWVLEQKGQGPGEFQRIVDLSLSRDGRVFIADQDQRKIMIFSDTGEFIDEFKVEGGSPLRIAVDSKSFIYIFFLDFTGDFLLHKYNPGGKLIHAFIEADKSEKNSQLRNSKNSIFFCIDRNDDVVVTFQYEYTILKYSPDGKLKARWTQPLPFKPRKIKIESPQPGWWQVVGDLVTQDIGVDNGNNIYVIWGSQKSDDGFRIDIFSSDGQYLAHFYPGVKPMEDWQYFHIDSRENLYIIDPLIEPKVFRFQMSRK